MRTEERVELQQKIPVPIGGFNTKDPVHLIPDIQGTDAWNVEIDEVLGVSKRSGFTTYNSATAVIVKYNTGTIKEITGPMVYGSGAAWTGGMVAMSDIFKMNGENIFYSISTVIGSNTMSLAIPYTGTATAGGNYVVSPNGINGIANYKYGTVQKLIVFAGKEAYSSVAGLTGTFAPLGAALTNNTRVSHTIFQDKLFFCDGYSFKYYDGSSVSSVSGSPNLSDPKYVCLYTIGNANYLVIAGSNTDAKKSQFQLSDVNAIGTWPAANIYYAGDRDGTVITGICQIASGLLIFKENSIFLFTGLADSGTLRKVVDDVGCKAPYSLVEHEGLVYFIGERGGKLGLFVYDGSPNPTCLSNSIEPTLAALNKNYTTNICATIFDDKYILSSTSSSGTFNNVHFSCYIRRSFTANSDTYWPWVRGNRGYNALQKFDYNGTTYLFSGSPTNGFVYREEYGTDDDTTDTIFGVTSGAIDSYVFSKWWDFGDSSRDKEIKRAYLEVTNSGDWNLDFRLYKDFQTYGYTTYNINLSSNTLTWQEVVFLVTPWQSAVDKSVQEVNFQYPNFGKFFRFRWGNATSAQYFTVYPLTIFYKVENV